MSDDPVPPLPPVDPTTAEVPAASLSPELLASLLTSGDDELAAWTLQHALRESPRAVVYDGLLREAMHLVGEHGDRPDARLGALLRTDLLERPHQRARREVLIGDGPAA